VPAKLGLEGLADFVILQGIRHRLEFRYEAAARGPAQVAALGGRTRIIRNSPGDGCEILTLVNDALTYVVELLMGRGVIQDLIGPDKNVAGMNLVYNHRLHTPQADQS